MLDKRLQGQNWIMGEAKLGSKAKNPVDPASLSAADLQEVEAFLAAIDANNYVQNIFAGLAG